MTHRIHILTHPHAHTYFVILPHALVRVSVGHTLGSVSAHVAECPGPAVHVAWVVLQSGTDKQMNTHTRTHTHTHTHILTQSLTRRPREGPFSVHETVPPFPFEGVSAVPLVAAVAVALVCLPLALEDVPARAHELPMAVTFCVFIHPAFVCAAVMVCLVHLRVCLRHRGGRDEGYGAGEGQVGLAVGWWVHAQTHMAHA
jgi:hypothetical protein